MNKDLKRIVKESDGLKIITKHEWMIAAIEALEQNSEQD